MKTLKSLIDATEWTDIEKTLLDLYPDFTKSISGFHGVFEKLKIIVPEKKDNLVLCIEFVSESYADEIETWHHVYGKDEEDDCSYALGFQPWSEWLGMNISTETLENYTEKEIIAHAIYDMTFYGFDEKTIQDEIKRIEAEANEFKNMTPEERKANTILADELFADLNKKFEKLKNNENL